MPSYFPWDRLDRGQGFFVPALDLDAMREAGLLAAVPLRLKDARATYGIKDGQLGVLFYRKAPGRSARGESSLDGRGQAPRASDLD
jgi:hypothetical protein